MTADKEDSEFIPSLVELPGKVIQITAGDSHTAALLEGGRVFAWGTFRVSFSNFVIVLSYIRKFQDSHGNMGLTTKGNEKLPYEILTNKSILKIASGADHIVFLTNHGEVYTCGCAEQGQLGRTTGRGSDRTARSGFGKVQIGNALALIILLFM